MKLPYFSIIMPTHLRPALLERALKSIKANTYKDVEIIVVADQIDADSFVVAAANLSESDTFIKRTGKSGPTESRNLGISIARGQRIIFLDDDDALLPDFLTKAKTFCDKFPNEVLYTNFRVIEEDRENPSASTKTTDISVKDRKIEDVYVKNFIHNHTCLYPATSLKNRQQDSHLASLDDWEFLLNVLSGSDFRHIDINGPVIYKDYVNTGNRRGTSDGAQGSLAIADYLYIYRRWPAPNPQLKQQRKELLKSVGLDVPLEWV